MRKFDAHSLALIKYQPDQILFMHKQSRLLYRYFNSARQPTSSPQIQHPNLLKSIAFNQGVLYPKQQSTLLKEIEIRKRSHSNKEFSQQEIVNTFLPLFQCLSVLQQQKIIHGAIHLQSIVMIQEEIKLRDWQVTTKLSNQYYNQKVQLLDDVAALCSCLINCVVLETTKPQYKQLQKMLEGWFEKFSKSFFVVLVVIVKQLKEHYCDIIKLLEGQTKVISGKLAELYEVYTEKKKVHTNGEQTQSALQFSQNKKMPFVNGKKVVHHENIQNKVDILQVKKLNEKTSKILEKSAHELMTKKINEEQKKTKEQQPKKTVKVPILNFSNAGIENKSKKLQKESTGSFGVIRSFSRKK